jgi:hypothetical protein
MDTVQAPARAEPSLVRKLIRQIDDPAVSVGTLLRTAKIIAAKLEQDEALEWINKELNGYWGLTLEELPEYRRVHGVARAFRPGFGWEPILWKDPEDEAFISQVPLATPLANIEESLEGCEGYVTYKLPPELRLKVWEAIDLETDVHVQVSASFVHGAVEMVRNLLLDWTLKLEKARVLGNEMVFTAEEREEAATVTNNFFGNTAVFGAASDHATINNNQTATVTLDMEAVRSLAQQARAALHSLPEEAAPVVDKIERLVSEPEPDQPTLLGLLRSLKTIAEGAAGNLTAAGLVHLVTKLLASAPS